MNTTINIDVEKTIADRVKEAIQHLNGTSVIDPSKVADHAIKRLTHDLVRSAAHLHLRQVAREALRRYYGKQNDKKPHPSVGKDAEPTFAGADYSLLQDRYPKSHMPEGERGYVLRDDMTEEDWKWNLDQLESESNIKAKHARQLESWGRKMKGFVRRETAA